MSSPIIWGPSGSKFIGNPQGTSGTVLTNDGVGNLSWAPVSSSGPTSFTIVNNQTSPADVTGFLVNPVSNSAFESDFSIIRKYAGLSDGAPVNAFNTALGDPSFSDFINDLVIQSDGKVVVVGIFTQFKGINTGFIARINPDGTLDTDFNDAIGVGADAQLTAIALQSNGQLIISGDQSNFNGVAVQSIFRLNADGTTDTTFSTNTGTVTGRALQIVIDPSTDAIFGVGHVSLVGSTTANGVFKTDINGNIDAAFYGNFGAGLPTGGTAAIACAEQANGQFVIGGNFVTFNGNTRDHLIRINADGTEDATFYTNLGTGGVNGAVLAVAIEAAQTVLISGNFTDIGTTATPGAARLSTAGLIDTTFTSNLGTGGAGNNAATIAVQSDGLIILAGNWTSWNGNSTSDIVRLNAIGTEDTAFSTAVGTGFDSANTVSRVVLGVDNIAYVVGDFLTLNSVNHRALALLGIPPTELAQQATLRGVYKNTYVAEWSIGGLSGIGDDAGVLFSMTAAGQLQYTSSNVLGTLVTSVMKFFVEAL